MLQQHLHTQTIVAALSSPSRSRSSFIDRDAVRCVPSRQASPVGKRRSVVAQDAVERLAVRLNKAKRAIIEHLNVYRAFMNFAVVETT